MRSLMNPNNIMKWLGILFVIIGIVVFVIAVAMRSVFDLQGSVLFGVFFLAIFGGVGGFFAKIGITNLRSDDKVLEEAGFELRLPSCSACLAMNPDKVPAGKLSISTSNRNFVGRQGPGARTVLASPLVVAASAITGKITDPRKL